MNRLNPNQKKIVKTQNHILNLSIILLSLILIFLTYELVSELNDNQNEIAVVETNFSPKDLIHVEVLNGCGIPSLVDSLTEQLRKNKFDVIQTGNYFSFDVPQTLVIDRIGDMKAARIVADSLNVPIENVIQLKNENLLLDVTVIIGKDFNLIKPFRRNDN